MNIAIVAGCLSSTPRLLELGSGDVLVRYEVTTPGAGRADSVPVAWLGAAERQPPPLAAGDAVLVVGRVRRRWFGGAGGRASATEVVAEAVVPATDKRRAAAVLRRALASATANT